MSYKIVNYTENERIFLVTDLEREVFFEARIPETMDGSIKFIVADQEKTVTTFEKPMRDIKGSIVPKTLTEIIEELYYGHGDESGGR